MKSRKNLTKQKDDIYQVLDTLISPTITHNINGLTPSLAVKNRQLEKIKNFSCLSTIISKFGGTIEDISSQFVKTCSAYIKLANSGN